MKVVCLILQDPSLVSKMAEACLRLSPQVACGSHNSVFLEISQCEHLFSTQTILNRIQVLLKKLSLQAQIAVGSDAPCALASAIHKQKELSLLPLEALHEFANPFNKEAFEKKDIHKMIHTLNQIGITHMGGFLKLSAKDVTNRFGGMGLTLFNRALGKSPIPWPRFHIEEKLIERLEWAQDNPCGDFDSISFLLRTLVERINARAFGRGQRIVSFVLKLEIEKNSLIQTPLLTWNFTFPLPQGHSKTILALIRDKLSYDLSIKPLASPVLAAEVEVLEVAPTLSRQKDLLQPHLEETQEAWNSIVARLNQKLGPSDVFIATPQQSYLPEKSWRRASVTSATATAADMDLATLFPERPSRVFSTPKPVEIVGSRILFNHMSWRILSWEGPEVLAGEWWEEAFERIYFKVHTHTGEQLWIYRVPDSDQVFLHGLFD